MTNDMFTERNHNLSKEGDVFQKWFNIIKYFKKVNG
jgi:hypothetical protein